MEGNVLTHARVPMGCASFSTSKYVQIFLGEKYRKQRELLVEKSWKISGSGRAIKKQRCDKLQPFCIHVIVETESYY